MKNNKENERSKGEKGIMGRLLAKKVDEVYHGIPGKMESHHASVARSKALPQEEFTTFSCNLFQWLIILGLN